MNVDTRTLPRASAWRRPDVLSASLAMNLLALGLPLVVLQVYDRIIPNQSFATLGVLIGMLLVCVALDAVLSLCRAGLMTHAGSRFEYEANMTAMQAVIEADLAAFDKDSRGAQLERFQAIDALREFMHGNSMLMVVELPFVVLFLALIWQFSGRMVLIPIVMIAVFLILSYVAGRILREAMASRARHHERRQNFLIECLKGIHTVKALALEQQILRRYERLQRSSAGSVYDLVCVNALIHGLASTFSQAVMVVFVALGSVSVVEGELTVGALAAGTMLAGRVLQPALRALAFWTHRQTIAEKEQKLLTLAKLKSETINGTEAAGRLRGAVRLEHVSFTFPGFDVPLLKDICLDISAGSAVSIRGPNGSGKSTLLNLIMGFIVPSEGQVLLDERDIRDLDRATVRPQIALIPQHGILFGGDLLQNMVMGRGSGATNQALELSHALGLDTTIRRLPLGLDTQTTSGHANNLAQGFVQRLVTVRALLGEPAIVLFDDANSGFDQRNDDRLRDLLASLVGHCTLVVISHRPSLQRLCSQHYELRDGSLTAVTGSMYANRHDSARLRVLRSLSSGA